MQENLSNLVLDYISKDETAGVIRVILMMYIQALYNDVYVMM